MHRLTNLSDRLIDLVLDVQGADLAPLRSEEERGDWEWHFGGSSAYEPSVAAGMFGLSAAAASAVRERTLNAGEIAAATSSFEKLPERYEEDRSSPEALAAAFRRYMLVPTVAAVRVLWIGIALCRGISADSPESGRIDESFRRLWREFADLGDEPVGRETLVKGMVMMHAASVLEPATTARPSLDFSDLTGLAAQGSAARAEHGGQGAVAVAFQRRLVDLLASFNCRIVAAKPADPLGDIYLELPEGDFVLIDAKSTAAESGYSLPKDDQDAIARYVADAPQLLPLGRRFRAVLIVGPHPSASLSQRAEALESRMGCDIRFCSASHLVQFRESFPGGSLQGLDNVLHACPYVLPDEWWQPLVRRSQAENDRLAAYLRQGLSNR